MALRDKVWDENGGDWSGPLTLGGRAEVFLEGGLSLSGHDIRATTISVNQTRASAAKQLIRGVPPKKKKKEKIPWNTQCYTTAKDRNLWRSKCQIVERS